MMGSECDHNQIINKSNAGAHSCGVLIVLV
jgi:hypothetical protein